MVPLAATKDADVSLIEEPGAPRTRRAAVKERLHECDELYRLLAEHSTDMISKHTPPPHAAPYSATTRKNSSGVTPTSSSTPTASQKYAGSTRRYSNVP